MIQKQPQIFKLRFNKGRGARTPQPYIVQNEHLTCRRPLASTLICNSVRKLQTQKVTLCSQSLSIQSESERLQSSTVFNRCRPEGSQKYVRGSSKNAETGVPVVARWLTNPTRNHEVAGSVPALAQWVNDSALP